MAIEFVQGGLMTSLACSIDALNRAAEIAEKIRDKKLRYKIGAARAEISALIPLIEKLSE